MDKRITDSPLPSFSRSFETDARSLTPENQPNDVSYVNEVAWTPNQNIARSFSEASALPTPDKQNGDLTVLDPQGQPVDLVIEGRYGSGSHTNAAGASYPSTGNPTEYYRDVYQVYDIGTYNPTYKDHIPSMEPRIMKQALPPSPGQFVLATAPRYPFSQIQLFDTYALVPCPESVIQVPIDEEHSQSQDVQVLPTTFSTIDWSSPIFQADQIVGGSAAENRPVYSTEMANSRYAHYPYGIIGHIPNLYQCGLGEPENSWFDHQFAQYKVYNDQSAVEINHNDSRPCLPTLGGEQSLSLELENQRQDTRTDGGGKIKGNTRRGVNGQEYGVEWQGKMARRAVSGAPPCAVCGELSSGKHYNVFTDESCKLFFKRNHKNRENIKPCLREGNCIVDGEQRKHCKACRMEKCLQVGMGQRKK